MEKSKWRSYDIPHLRRQGVQPAERMPESVPHCWFCASRSGGKSREHVFPRWLRDRYVDKAPFHPVRFVPRAALLGLEPWEDSRKADVGPNQLVAGNVCQTCNGGWMSALEHRVKPLLEDSSKIRELEPEAAVDLARWFAKTSAVINVSQPYRLLWPMERRHALAGGDLSHVLVGLSRIPSDDLNWIQANPSTFMVDGELRPWMNRAIALTHQCSIQVGSLVGTVLLLPPEIAACSIGCRPTMLCERGQIAAVSMNRIARAKDLTDAWFFSFTPRIRSSALMG